VRTAEGERACMQGEVALDLTRRQYAMRTALTAGFPRRSRYLASALRALVEYVPLKVRIDFPGSTLISWEAKALLAAVLKAPTYGAGLSWPWSSS